MIAKTWCAALRMTSLSASRLGRRRIRSRLSDAYRGSVCPSVDPAFTRTGSGGALPAPSRAARTTWGGQTNELWMYHVLGGSGLQVTRRLAPGAPPTTPRGNAIGVVASPDGKYLYYARRNGGFQYNAQFPLWQIARRDRVTGIEDIITNELGSAIRPLLSPDGSKLVYGTRYETQTGLRIRDLDTGEDRWLKYPVTRDDQESRFTRDVLPGYAFLPNGQEIVVSIGGKIQRVNVASGAARPIPFTAKVSQEIGPSLNFQRRIEDGPVRARIIQDATQSPDGRRLAFSTFLQVYVQDLPGGTPRRLTAHNSIQRRKRARPHPRRCDLRDHPGRAGGV